MRQDGLDENGVCGGSGLATPLRKATEDDGGRMMSGPREARAILGAYAFLVGDKLGEVNIVISDSGHEGLLP